MSEVTTAALIGAGSATIGAVVVQLAGYVAARRDRKLFMQDRDHEEARSDAAHAEAQRREDELHWREHLRETVAAFLAAATRYQDGLVLNAKRGVGRTGLDDLQDLADASTHAWGELQLVAGPGLSAAAESYSMGLWASHRRYAEWCAAGTVIDADMQAQLVAPLVPAALRHAVLAAAQDELGIVTPT